MYGLLDRDIKYILEAIGKFEEIEKVILFGSRAMGNYKKGSDIDIAVSGKKVTINTILKLSDYLNEVYPLPYYFDIIHYENISNENLKKHIDTYGKEIYIKK
ncbi:nucleotidyltransferase domain protein [Clostridium tepidiprofundi DSM 19306]|uniref:Nucleotidyltransferase domain protein n=1 Tax=Clostridium tepidiprofundi DSM 19306 TaxID=1121338 RepID=A0A151B484_9CLOT|nr:nucleotidyltransferase domain-containing protein [Clostridium tepidiprofundi]KYH34731.1 nucleotidyltransferase domain protein [Clostridium tepidiprofundi DSM 19306]